jgi:glycerophosphoryl diester phosphodiesterase
MRQRTAILSVTFVALFVSGPLVTGQTETGRRASGRHQRVDSVQLGPRPFFLINDMSDGRLKWQLQSCTDGPYEQTAFSIGHRGACL